MTPLLPLETFRQILGWHPFWFWGLANEDVPVTQECPQILRQYAWQGVDAAGRADIELALESAEGLLRDYLGYDVAPAFREVKSTWPRYYDNSRDRLFPADATGRWIAPLLDKTGYIEAIGVESLTLVGTVTKSDPPVGGDSLVFTDTDGDGLMDTFTATIATAETDADKIAIYFVAADRLESEPAGEAWRIRPVRVTISGGSAVIIGKVWTIVRPILYQGVNPQPLDPGDITAAGPYAQSLQVYVRTCDPTGTTVETAQSNIIWETSPCHGWWCCCSGCSSPDWNPQNSPRDPAAIATAIARATVRDAHNGLVGLGEAVYNATSDVWSATGWGVCREPDRYVVRVLAGHPLENQAMTRKFQIAVARLAMAELARPVCACEKANRELFHWQFDLGRSAGSNDEVYGFVTRETLNNPLGTRRGHLFAFQQIKSLRLLPGVIAG